MKKLIYLIVLVLILGLVLTGCSLLSNISQVPSTEQSGMTYLTRSDVDNPYQIDLLAGQTDDIGDVLVWNDAESLYVKFVYAGTECGFLEVHLQVDEESFSADILTKKGNPIPGKFEKSYDVGCFLDQTFIYNLADESFDFGDELLIAAHAVVPSGGANVDKYATNVFSVTPGTGSVREPSETLGAPDSAYEVESFYSLGFGGCIELEFADFVGGTLTVYETTWHHFEGDTYPKESANIYVSANGSDWTYLGEANNDGQSWSNTPVPNVFILGECIKYVKICDTTDPSLFGSGANAFDIDAIEGQYFCKKETAWGDGIRFVDKGNWATYFTVMVEEPPVPVPVTLGFSGDIEYYDSTGTWVTFKKPSMEMVPATYEFRFRDENGGYPWAYVEIEVSGDKVEKSIVVLRLLDSNGDGIAGGKAKWADGSWHSIPGTTDTNGLLIYPIPGLKGNLRIVMTYRQGSVVISQYQPTNSCYLWQTVEAVIKLIDNDGNGLAGGKVDQGGGYWEHHGYTDDNGEFKLDMFPGSYEFRMSYNHTSQQKWQDISTDVIFQTGQVVSAGDAIKASLGGSWITFTHPSMQLLPGTYTFVFTSYPTSESITVTAALITNIR